MRIWVVLCLSKGESVLCQRIWACCVISGSKQLSFRSPTEALVHLTAKCWFCSLVPARPNFYRQTSRRIARIPQRQPACRGDVRRLEITPCVLQGASHGLRNRAGQLHLEDSIRIKTNCQVEDDAALPCPCPNTASTTQTCTCALTLAPNLWKKATPLASICS